MNNTELLITAWGETKTAAEWAQDDRATADEKIILKRLECGQLAESAIGYQKRFAKYHRKPINPTKAVIPFNHKERANARLILAWGEEKSITEWSQDPRCAVTVSCISSRLDEGFRPENAIGMLPRSFQPKGGTHRPMPPIEAFGITQDILDWLADSRCVVDEGVLRGRLQNKWTPEEALSIPLYGRRDGSRGPSKLLKARPTGVAFGEQKLLSQWARDPRCKVSYKTFFDRVNRGIPVEQAMNDQLYPTPGKLILARNFEAFGEIKTLQEWMGDPRRTADHRLVLSRARTNWKGELSLLAQRTTKDQIYRIGDRPLAAFGETKTLDEWIADPRCRTTLWALARRLDVGLTPEQAITLPRGGFSFKTGEIVPSCLPVEAFGESKSLVEWSRDSRCKITRHCLVHRVSLGWDVERAITTPKLTEEFKHLRKKPDAKTLYTAFGETKSMPDWVRDPRCSVSSPTISHRLAMGLTMEQAITLKKHDLAIKEAGTSCLKVTAWGETKTLEGWTLDSRMKVSRECAYGRIVRGIAPELAIGGTRKDLAKVQALVRPDNSPLVTAWGVTKSLRQWMSDPLCKVTYDNALRRLKSKLTPEQVLGVDRLPQATMLNNQIPVYEAFGETKPMREWLLDPRLQVAQGALSSRLEKGWPLELAMTTPSKRGQRVMVAVHHDLAAEGRSLVTKIAPEKLPSLTKNLTAWDETKSIREWGRDKRCPVHALTVAARIAEGLSHVEAIALPLRTQRSKNNAGGVNLFYEAFGEFKTIEHWSYDPRARVAWKTIVQRIRGGESHEKAIRTAPRTPNEKADLAGFRLTKSPVTAFGETKLTGHWALDPRCRVAPITITKRIRRGWKPEDAISQPTQAKQPKGDSNVWNGHLIEAFGEKKSALEWSRDPRSSVTEGAIAGRIKKGWDPVAAITEKSRINYASPESRRGSGGPRILTAFGESKSLTEWSKDARCKVSAVALGARLRRGMAVESAITTPTDPNHRSMIKKAA